MMTHGEGRPRGAKRSHRIRRPVDFLLKERNDHTFNGVETIADIYQVTLNKATMFVSGVTAPVLQRAVIGVNRPHADITLNGTIAQLMTHVGLSLRSEVCLHVMDGRVKRDCDRPFQA